MARGDLTKQEGRLHTAATSLRRRSRPARYGRTEWPWRASCGTRFTDQQRACKRSFAGVAGAGRLGRRGVLNHVQFETHSRSPWGDGGRLRSPQPRRGYGSRIGRGLIPRERASIQDDPADVQETPSGDWGKCLEAKGSAGPGYWGSRHPAIVLWRGVGARRQVRMAESLTHTGQRRTETGLASRIARLRT